MTKVATRGRSIWLYLELINPKERQGTDPLLTVVSTMVVTSDGGKNNRTLLKLLKIENNQTLLCSLCS